MLGSSRNRAGMHSGSASRTAPSPRAQRSQVPAEASPGTRRAAAAARGGSICPTPLRAFQCCKGTAVPDPHLALRPSEGRSTESLLQEDRDLACRRRAVVNTAGSRGSAFRGCNCSFTSASRRHLEAADPRISPDAVPRPPLFHPAASRFSLMSVSTSASTSRSSWPRAAAQTYHLRIVLARAVEVVAPPLVPGAGQVSLARLCLARGL
jgi:hypothetical protein